MNEGMVASRLGIAGLPGLAEEVVVARDISIAADTGSRLHVQHVSTANAVELIRQAKGHGVAVTAEVTPHHLALDDSALEDLDPNFKMYPPLRGQDDCDALRTALREGVIDAVATDHAPHTAAEKAVPFEEAPRGVIGLETAAAVVASCALGDDQAAFFDRMSVAPARIAGLDRHGSAVEAGGPANLVLFDPGHRWVPGSFSSKSQNSPFVGMELTGRVLATIFEGAFTYEEGLILTAEQALLCTADGATFRGRSVGASGVSTGEAVFNTSMTGYQEILTDPSYAGQVVVMTSSHIGNYGVFAGDDQSARPAVAGFVDPQHVETGFQLAIRGRNRGVPPRPWCGRRRRCRHQATHPTHP